MHVTNVRVRSQFTVQNSTSTYTYYNTLLLYQSVPTHRTGFGELISCGTRGPGEWSGDGVGLFGSYSSIGGVPQSSQLCCWIFGARGLDGGLRLHAIVFGFFCFNWFISRHAQCVGSVQFCFQSDVLPFNGLPRKPLPISLLLNFSSTEYSS